MKARKILQTLAKIGKIFSKIVSICSLIGAIFCAVGLVMLPFGEAGVLKLGGVSIYGLIVNRTGVALESLYPVLAAVLLVCAGQVVTARFAWQYFRHELQAGTPFTPDGAKELLRLGIVTACVPLGAQIASQIVSSILAQLVGIEETYPLESGSSVGLGIALIVMSLLCQYGASLHQPQKALAAEPTDVEAN